MAREGERRGGGGGEWRGVKMLHTYIPTYIHTDHLTKWVVEELSLLKTRGRSRSCKICGSRKIKSIKNCKIVIFYISCSLTIVVYSRKKNTLPNLSNSQNRSRWKKNNRSRRRNKMMRNKIYATPQPCVYLYFQFLKKI